MFLKGREILLTGGTGTLGKNLIPKLLKYNPKAIRILARRGHDIVDVIRPYDPNIVKDHQGDVRDIERLRIAMKGVDYVIHAAAEKRIDSCERNPLNALDVNTIGSKNVYLAAMESGVKKCLFISTDKAYNPTTFYGYTKAVAEQLALRFNLYAEHTKYSSLRYGNIWKSKGSVIELWDRLYKEGKTLEITVPGATRFFMTIDEASDLVINSLKKMEGGELFVKEMKAITLGDLVEGRYPGAEIRVIGWRCEEKLHEGLKDGYYSNEHLVTYKQLAKELKIDNT